MESGEKQLAEEILYDPRYKDQFLAVREDRTDDGSLIGNIIAVGKIPDEVHASLKKDQEKHPNAKYLFAKPMEKGSDIRQHYTIRKEE